MNDLGDLGSDLLGEAGDGVVTLEEAINNREIVEEALITLDVDVGANANAEELTLLLTTGELLESLLDILELYNILC